jgi:hypothetical protein
MTVLKAWRPSASAKTFPRGRNPLLSCSPASSARHKSTRAPATGRQVRVSTAPESSTGRPAIPGSRRSLRRCDRGLKKGPLGLRNGRLVPVMTGRGRRQVPLGEGAVGERARGGKGAPIGPLASLLAWPAGCSTALCTETSPDSAGVIPVNSAAVFRRRPRPRGSGGIGANAKASPSGGDEPGLLRLARHV